MSGYDSETQAHLDWVQILLEGVELAATIPTGDHWGR